MHPLAEYIYEDVSRNQLVSLDFSELNSKTILITGATGIIGTYLTAQLKYLSDKKNLSFKFISFVHGEPDKYYKDLLPRDTNIVRGDLSEIKTLTSLPQADYVIHAAGYGQPGKFLEDPIKTIKINTLATLFLLEKLNPEGKFLFASTSEIYSGSKNMPYKETDIGTTNTYHKRSCYIEGKRSGEAIAFAFRSKGVSAKVARLSLAYGPGTKRGDQRVLNAFIEKALTKKHIDMLDDGNAKRTYCYVSDATELLWQILLSGKDFVYNVAGESKTTIKELAEQISNKTDACVSIPKSSKTLSGAPDDVWLNLEKTKKEFGKEQFVSLDDGLSRTIDWQKILYKQ